MWFVRGARSVQRRPGLSIVDRRTTWRSSAVVPIPSQLLLCWANFICSKLQPPEPHTVFGEEVSRIKYPLLQHLYTTTALAKWLILSAREPRSWRLRSQHFQTISLTGGSRDGHGAACLPPFSKGKKKQDQHLLHLSSCHYITSFLFARLNSKTALGPAARVPLHFPFLPPLLFTLAKTKTLYVIKSGFALPVSCQAFPSLVSPVMN